MVDPRIIRANEKRKAWSSMFFNLGGALAAAVAIRVYDRPTFDLSVLIWSIGSFFLILVGHSLLGQLEDDGL